MRVPFSLRPVLLATCLIGGLPVLAGTAQAQPVSGVYVGVGAGVNFMQSQSAMSYYRSTASWATTSMKSSSIMTGKLFQDPGVAAVGSVGWGFGNGFRVEIEGNYRENTGGKWSWQSQSWSGLAERKYGVMANVLFDMDVGSPYIYPYVGAGFGWQRVEQLTTNYLGNTYAYQAIAGVSAPIPWVVGLSATFEYRFMGVPGYSKNSTDVYRTPTFSASTDSGVKLGTEFNHTLMVGLRYAFNTAPPPPVAAPTPPAPVAEAARTYLVFFDWDKYALTDRAKQIIAQAAQATTRVQVTRIEVSGHTDTTGSAQYNQGLSVRRANAVAAELIRLGVPKASITAQGFGFSRPLVATGPNVREPQNRRVEIVLK